MRGPMFLFIFLLLAAAPISLTAQSSPTPSACAPLVTEALQAIGSNCDSMDRNSACYGYNRVEAEFTRVQAEDFFTQPADRAQLVDLRTIQTSPLSVNSADWGIAVLNLQANLPQFLPGQSVIFLMIGDVSMENTAPTNVPVFPIVITTVIASDARSAPDEMSSSYGELVPGSQVALLGKDAGEEWVRADIQNIIAWLPVSAFEPVQIEAALAQLSIVEEDAPLPMQAFTLRTSFDDTGFECAEAPPSLLLVQGPERVQVTFNVNGADVQIASTVVLYQPAEDTLRLATLDGEATVGDDQFIPQGFAANARLNEDGEVEEWEETEPMSQEELDRLRSLELLNDSENNGFNYPIDVPDEEALMTPTRTPTLIATRRPFTATPLPTATATAAATSTPEPFVSFRADSGQIMIQECTFVRWETANIDSVYFEGEPTVGVSERQVCPTQTTTYTLLVRFRDGTEQRFPLTIEVTQPTRGSYCGDQICDTGAGEDGCNCYVDCGTYMCPG